MSLRLRFLASLSMALLGCPDTRKVVPGDADSDSDVDTDVDSDVDTDTGSDTGCDPADADGDGLADADEAPGDTDADGTTDAADTDDDGDRILSADEVGDGDPCTPARDTDGDGEPDARDLDSDDDGLDDRDESTRGTGVTDFDTDDDCIPDGSEIAFGYSPLDGGIRLDLTGSVVLPFGGAAVDADVELTTELESADVVFLVDTTGSMGGTINALQSELDSTIVPGVQAQFGDLQMGVVEFEDFQSGTYGSDCDFGGGRGKDQAFRLLQEVTSVFDLVQDALDLLDDPMGCGGDLPESYVEALYQSATGEGIDDTNDDSDYAEPVDCTIADRIGGACVRPGVLPIFVLFGDAEFHNGPPDGSVNAYAIADADPAPHTFPQAMDALNAIGAKVIGLTAATFGNSLDHMRQTATATGALDGDGTALAFQYRSDGVGLGDTVVDAITSLVSETPSDVTIASEDFRGDDVDGTGFVDALAALSANPPGGIAGMDGARFVDVLPGTLLTFRATLSNDVVDSTAHVRIYAVDLVVTDEAGVRLDSVRVIIQVPGADGSTCE